MIVALAPVTEKQGYREQQRQRYCTVLYRQVQIYIQDIYIYCIFRKRQRYTDRDIWTEIFRQRKRDIYYNIYTQLKIQLETEISRHK